MLRITIDTTRFSAALAAYMATTKKELPRILNQRAYNVAGRAAGKLPPTADPQASRASIRAYLRAPLSTQVKIATSGKRKGKLIRRGGRGRQLQRVHLIVNKLQGKLGRPGLWGGATGRTAGGSMHQYAGEFVRRAQVGVGVLRAAYLPIIRGLYPHIDYRRIDGPNPHPFRRISQWPGSVGNSTVDPARPSWNPFVELVVRMQTPGVRRLGRASSNYVMSLQINALSAAMAEEAAELEAHIRRKLGTPP